MELLQFTIAANETKVFVRSGRYFEIIDAQAAINVDFQGIDAQSIDGMRGALAGFFSEGPFAGFSVNNPTAASQSITLMISDGRGGSRRQPGLVQVVDGGRVRSISGQSFVAYAAVTTAAQRAHLQILNPAGSGRRTIIKTINVSTDTANVLRVGRLIGALGTQQTTVARKLVQAAAGQAGVEARVETLTNISANFTQHFALIMGANSRERVQLDDPYVLEQGEGLGIAGDAVNGTVTMWVEGVTEAPT